VKLATPRYEDIIIDAGGHDSGALRAALTLSDAVLVPFPPRTFDLWALADMAALVQEAQGLRDGPDAYAVLNAADPGVSADNGEAVAALADHPVFIAMEVKVTRRKSFPTASGFGLSVEEMTPRDPKAIEEMEKLVRALFPMV
jgi:chromosome partitioning protein